METDSPIESLGCLLFAILLVFWAMAVLIRRAVVANGHVWIVGYFLFMVAIIAFTGAHMQKHNKVTRLLLFNSNMILGGLYLCKTNLRVSMRCRSGGAADSLGFLGLHQHIFFHMPWWVPLVKKMLSL